MMRLTAENSFSINEMLQTFSDDFFVDRCESSFDPKASTFQAVFVSEDFAKCLVTKTLSRGCDVISEDDLRLIAGLANQELERQMGEIGMKATFNESTRIAAALLPEGYDLEIVYEDPATDPSAAGIDWRAIA